MSADGHDGGEDRILLVAPTRRDADVTARLLGTAGLSCVAVQLGELAREICAGVAVVILTDRALVAPDMDGVLAAFGRQPSWSDIPTLVLARESSLFGATASKLAALTNVSVLDLPSSTREISSAVQSAFRARRRQYQIRDHLIVQKAAEQALKDADRRKDEFLATLAHEIRNPLSAFSSGIEVLAGSELDAARSARMVAMMKRQSQVLVRLVDELLDVSRIATGKVVIRREPVDLRAVVDAALETGETVNGPGRHDIRIDVSSGPLWVIGDQERLVQVVGNVINNAIKYTPDGERIDVALQRAGAQAVIRVRDAGAGIPADMLEQVFDMFSQVDRTLDRADGGLGIGLSLVRSLVALHGGSVVATSAGAGQGSEFEIRLPIAQSQPAPSRAAEAAAASSQDGLRILLIDDNVDVAESFGAVLELDDHTIRIEHSGAAGLAAADEFRPDVIFCDIGMAGMDGYEVARRLRHEARHASVLVVAITGWGTEQDRARSSEAGFDRHLTKPVDPREVAQLLVDFAAGRSR